MAFQRRSIPAPRLAACLPSEHSAGASHFRRPGSPPPALLDDELREAARASDTGYALFRGDGRLFLVLPPFPVSVDSDLDRIELAPLQPSIKARTCAVFLLRLGGFAIGVLEGDDLIDSKVDQRFVKNRHRKGGQSQRRFERIREKQVDELFKKACETARDKLTPHAPAIEHVFLGGDRRTLQAFRKRCDYFESFGPRLRARVLPVAGDPRHDTLTVIPRAIYSSDVYLSDDGGADTAG
jgi:hypothetical protein